MARKERPKEKSRDKHNETSAKESFAEQVEPDKTMIGLRKIATTILVACIIFLGLDGYFNRWGVVRTLIDWHTLELRGTDGSAWYLKSSSDFKLIEIDDPERIFSAENLAAFDQPYRDEGAYRLYFRISDSGSVRLQALYQVLASVDSTEQIQRTVEEAERAYRNLVRLLGFDTTAVADSIPLRRDGLRTPVVENSVAQSQDDAVGTTVVRFLSKSPQVLVGLGIGIAASAGADLLEGRTYVAVARGDCFRLDRLRVGARVGAWQGKSIDILWAFGRIDPPSPMGPRQMPVTAIPDSLEPADSGASVVSPDGKGL